MAAFVDAIRSVGSAIELEGQTASGDLGNFIDMVDAAFFELERLQHKQQAKVELLEQILRGVEQRMGAIERMLGDQAIDTREQILIALEHWISEIEVELSTPEDATRTASAGGAG